MRDHQTDNVFGCLLVLIMLVVVAVGITMLVNAVTEDDGRSALYPAFDPSWTPPPGSPLSTVEPSEPASAPEPAPEVADSDTSGTVEVVEVVDADTIDVRFPDGHTDTVRLIGLDAPEAGTCAGAVATAWAQTELGDRVRLVADPDIPNRGYYDRLLRYVRYDGDQDLGTELLVAGHADAQVYNDPPHRLVERYERVERSDGPPAGCY